MEEICTSTLTKFGSEPLVGILKFYDFKLLIVNQGAKRAIKLTTEQKWAFIIIYYFLLLFIVLPEFIFKLAASFTFVLFQLIT